jgi:hypothetical protein
MKNSGVCAKDVFRQFSPSPHALKTTGVCHLQLWVWIAREKRKVDLLAFHSLNCSPCPFHTYTHTRTHSLSCFIYGWLCLWEFDFKFKNSFIFLRFRNSCAFLVLYFWNISRRLTVTAFGCHLCGRTIITRDICEISEVWQFQERECVCR